MGYQGDGQRSCLDEDVALDFVGGRLSEAALDEIECHVDDCSRCRLLLTEASRAARDRTAAPTGHAPVSFTRFAPGDRLAGRYEIVRFIARGGMGEVYEAHDAILNSRLALKTLAATISDNQDAIRRLKQEVNLARRITHPNVCRIFDMGVHEQSGPPNVPGVLFITMELVPGISLGEALRKEGRFSPARARPIVEAMAAALGAAHLANVVHRDFKSDNVMLSPGEGGPARVVVMDFGLARAARVSEQSSIEGPALTGTLPYMAPEQVEGKAVSPATDVYALGVVIFEMLTGQLPFNSTSPLMAAWKRVVEPAPALKSVVSELEPGWEEMVAGCLERDAARRPALNDLFFKELRRLGLADPRPTPRRGRAWAWGASVACLVTLLGGTTILYVQSRRQTSFVPAAVGSSLPPSPAPARSVASSAPQLGSPEPGLTGPANGVSSASLPEAPRKVSAPVRGRIARSRTPTANRGSVEAKGVSPLQPALVEPPPEKALPSPSADHKLDDPDEGFILR